MVDQHDAEQALPLGAGEFVVQHRQRRRVDMSGRHERRRSARRGHADQRDIAAAAQIGEADRARDSVAVAMQIGRPGGERLPEHAGHIGVVIARHDGDVLRRTEGLQPFARRDDLAGQADIDEVAGDGDVVRPLRDQIVEQPGQHRSGQRMHAAAAPVHIAEHPFRGELAGADARQRTEMRIGEMGEDEHRATEYRLSPGGDSREGRGYARAEGRGAASRHVPLGGARNCC